VRCRGSSGYAVGVSPIERMRKTAKADWFQVFDTGEGADAPPDRSSLLGFGSEAANEAFCNSPNLPRFGPWDVQGNVQVR
jgi:hypothetical protein